MGTPAALPSFVRAGATGAEELSNSESIFLKIKNGKPVQIIPLTGIDGIISFNQHALWLDEGSSPIFPCFGTSWCPGEIIGDKPKFRALMLCVTTEEPDREMILPMGIGMFKQVVGVSEAIGDIRGHILRITRTGEKLNTKYTVMPTNKRAKLSGEPETNLLEHLGEMDPDVVVEMLDKAGLWTDAHQEKYDRLRKAAKAAAKAAKAAAKVVEADDDEVEEEPVPAPKKKAAAPKPEPVETDLGEDEVEETPAPAPKKKAAAAPAPKDDDEFEDMDE
jgi:hypothetical protein